MGAHLAAAGALIDTDPELAYRHAEAARRRAARLPVVREAAAEAAYAAGEYAVALREFRALRRMNGSGDFLPVMADCERALGKPREALKLLAGIDTEQMDANLRLEALLVEAGARDDLGQHDEALRLLRAEITRRRGPKLGQARLRYAYAEMLIADGDTEGARQWLEAAQRLDVHQALGVDDRIAELDGLVIEPEFYDALDDVDELDEDEGEAPSADDGPPSGESPELFQTEESDHPHEPVDDGHRDPEQPQNGPQRSEGEREGDDAGDDAR